MSGSAIKSNSKHQQHLELKPLSLSDNLCLDIIILSKVELLDSFLFFANTYTSYRSPATATCQVKPVNHHLHDIFHCCVSLWHLFIKNPSHILKIVNLLRMSSLQLHVSIVCSSYVILCFNVLTWFTSS